MKSSIMRNIRYTSTPKHTIDGLSRQYVRLIGKMTYRDILHTVL